LAVEKFRPDGQLSRQTFYGFPPSILKYASTEP